MELWIAIVLSLGLGEGGPSSRLPLQPGWKSTATIEAAHAHQSAAADATTVYAVSSTAIARHDRKTGKLLSVATAPDVKHLNSAFIRDGKVYAAHSNYPTRPEASDIRRYDPATKELTTLPTFRDPPGSIVWCVHDGDRWWCCFAHYGKENGKTVLVRYDEGWKENARWTFPKKVIDDWDGMSASGGVFLSGSLIVTHHHFKVLYELKVPGEPGELIFVAAHACPFPGQGIAIDPVTGGLVGIDRNRRAVIFAEKRKSE
jgi:hypothetical protein